ncbi:MAG: hypothetical protein NC227_10790 [Bacteroides sp.]|nr:hypothetical protein [Bacteroides sp.]MCM1362774.1 hypothetical protein [Clostridiales bacterium]
MSEKHVDYEGLAHFKEKCDELYLNEEDLAKFKSECENIYALQKTVDEIKQNQIPQKVLTQAEYDSMPIHDDNTLYIIVG